MIDPTQMKMVWVALLWKTYIKAVAAPIAMTRKTSKAMSQAFFRSAALRSSSEMRDCFIDSL
jgi:hypothetical protein